MLSIVSEEMAKNIRSVTTQTPHSAAGLLTNANAFECAFKCLHKIIDAFECIP